jgi:cell division transport system permease protein
VYEVSFPGTQIDVLSKLKGFFGRWTILISGILLVVAVLLIWNTIRTAMFARRREIEVMKLVGATNWFIRVPFMLEGLLQGLLGSALASVSLLTINKFWTNGVHDFPENSGFAAFVVNGGYLWWVVLFMVLLGVVVGAIGSATAASRFLDV